MSHKKVAGRDQQPIEELQQNDEAIWPGQCGQCGQPSQTSSNRRNSRKCDQWSPRRRVEKGTKAGRQLEETQNSGISSKGSKGPFWIFWEGLKWKLDPNLTSWEHFRTFPFKKMWRAGSSQPTMVDMGVRRDQGKPQKLKSFGKEPDRFPQMLLRAKTFFLTLYYKHKMTKLLGNGPEYGTIRFATEIMTKDLNICGI